jgi:hypothetical protein
MLLLALAAPVGVIGWGEQRSRSCGASTWNSTGAAARRDEAGAGAGAAVVRGWERPAGVNWENSALFYINCVCVCCGEGSRPVADLQARLGADGRTDGRGTNARGGALHIFI